MARRNTAGTPHAITLRATHGKGLISIPIKIFCNSHSVSASGHSQASGRDLHSTSTPTDTNALLFQILTEKDQRITELKEHITELKERLQYLEKTPRTPTI